ncbi:hypothetical protein ACFSTI_05460 [Rhizorhabdus histidinilytica]
MTRLLSTALVAAVALLGPASATAAEDSLSLQLKVKRVLDYPKPIARIQVDREGVIAVRAEPPLARHHRDRNRLRDAVGVCRRRIADGPDGDLGRPAGRRDR